MRNVPAAGRVDLDSDSALREAVAAAQAELGEEGRVLLRASGTEPLVRIMVESTSHAESEKQADRLADAVSAAMSMER